MRLGGVANNLSDRCIKFAGPRSYCKGDVIFPIPISIPVSMPRFQCQGLQIAHYDRAK